jgi:RimJ/RimL family protein N-acetyltransferase
MVAEKEDLEDESLAIDRPSIATERLAMHRPRLSDAAELAVLANNRRVAEMLARMPHPYGEAEARSFIANEAVRRSGAVYVLRARGPGTLVGCAGLNLTDRGLEAGFWLGEPYWGRGFATEAAHALVDLAFEATAIGVLHASCRVINPASRRVLQKCGFQYAGQGMMNGQVAGQVPIERYRLDRKTWTSLRTWARILS